MQSTSQNRLVYLDSLRGLAALYVLIYHVEVSPRAGDGHPSTLHDIFHYGGSGVTLFFVLSAFSLSLTMPRHIKTGHPILSFATSRFFRIAPLFYALLLFALIRVTDFFTHALPMGHLLTSLTFTFNLFPRFVSSPVWGGWTIGVEMIFYAFFPLLYFRLPRLRGRIILTIALIVAYQVFHSFGAEFIKAAYWPRFDRRLLLHHMPSFMIGMIVFDLHQRLRDHDAHRIFGYAALAVGIAILAWMIFVGWEPPFTTRELGDAAGYGLILLGASLCDPWALRYRPLAYLGKISFSIYLWHLVVIWASEPVYTAIYGTALPVDVQYGYSLALTLALVIPVAHISYVLIEDPGVRLGRKVFGFLAGQRRPREAPSPSIGEITGAP